MARVKYGIAMTAAAFLAAQPCGATSDSSSSDERRMSTFAGLTIAMPLGQARRARPSARLQLTTSYNVRDVSTGSVKTMKAKRLEIGAAGHGAPTFYLNGQNTTEMREKLQLSGSTPDAVWIVFGVALVAVTVLVLTSGPILNGPILPDKPEN